VSENRYTSLWIRAQRGDEEAEKQLEAMEKEKIRRKLEQKIPPEM